MFNTSNPLRGDPNSMASEILPANQPEILPAVQKEWKGWQVVLLIFASMVVLGGIAYGSSCLARHVWNANPLKAGMITAAIELGILGAVFLIKRCLTKSEERQEDSQPLSQQHEEIHAASSNAASSSASSETTLIPASSANLQSQEETTLQSASTATSSSTQPMAAAAPAVPEPKVMQQNNVSEQPRDPNEPYIVAKGVDIDGQFCMDIFYDPMAKSAELNDVSYRSDPLAEPSKPYYFVHRNTDQREYRSKRWINICIERTNRDSGYNLISLLE